jgi:hypothetical protein
MAEDTGFEPAELALNGFQNRRFRPLSQSSAMTRKTNFKEQEIV